MLETLSHGQQEIAWNPNNRKEIDEAKLKYIQARKELRIVEPEKFNPQSGSFVIRESQIKEHEIMVRVVNETGDERVIWNLLDSKQVKESAQRFQQYIDKGWKAYAIRNDGSKGHRIHKFDAELEEIVFDDKTTRQKLKDFAKSFKKIEVLPKTTPG